MWLSDRMAEVVLAYLHIGDETGAQQLAVLHGFRRQRLGWWFRVVAATFALGARSPVRTAAMFGVGLLLQLVVGYAAADVINRLNGWLTPLIPMSWLDHHAYWVWAFAVMACAGVLVGWALAHLDAQIAVASVAGLILFTIVRCMLTIVSALLRRELVLVGAVSLFLGVLAQCAGLLLGLAIVRPGRTRHAY